MLVSTFELLVKRIAPLAPMGPSAPANAAFRRVVQGYFLIITNLDPSRTANLFLRFTIPSLPAASPDAFDREIVVLDPSNVRTGYDIAASDSVSLPLTLRSADANVKTFNTGRFSIGPLQTASVNLLPNLGNPDVLTREKMEIRGSVELLQTQGSILDLFNGVPAIDVLVTPEIRGTFLDNDYPSTDTTNELDFDQINYGLPVASGKGRNTVESVAPASLEKLPNQPKVPELILKNLADFNEQLSQYGLVVLPLEQETPVQ